MTTRQAGHLVIVYEAVNHDLKEIYVGSTDQLLHQAAEQLERCFPAEIAHWRRDHHIEYRAVDWSLPARYAESFIGAYAKLCCPIGWRTVPQSRLVFAKA
jgi:hypothetical protein